MPEFFKGVGAARFGVMAGVAAALTAFFLYVAGVIAEPPKSILYSGLAGRDATQITAKLDAMNVPYTLKDGGGTILVPADQVTKLRMDMAAQNLPSDGVGYEIFDKQDAFGTTAFVQNINKLRAMEGELARSIQTIDGIEAARVHLVIPERQLFSRDSTPPTASVVLKTSAVLDRGEVNAIQHLVAAAVAGLQVSRVAIIDDRGNLLAGGDGKDGTDATAAEDSQHTADYEDRMRKRIESIVASVVGPGHVRVQVAADMDYSHESQTSESYDPDSKVVRSTQTIETSSSDKQPGSSNAASVSTALPGGQQGVSNSSGSNDSSSTRDEETTNYEISKTVSTKDMPGGMVKRLSVAVVVDGTEQDGSGGKQAYVPRSKQEMAQIATLVKSAMGYDKARGDQVEVANMPFARMDIEPLKPEAKPLLGLDAAYWFKIIEAAILSLTALLIGLFVARPLIRNAFAPPGRLALAAPASAGQLAAPAVAGAIAGDGQALIAAGAAAPQLAPPKESMIDISRIEGQVRESSIRKVGEVVDSHPEEALAILRSWLHQPV
ncbi:MAG: flagellar M-ring protein FliF [Alphaproteobacteria bacterium]|nr:flagellar M-ring protein FliF [Alphaproteobacteria bacterium]